MGSTEGLGNDKDIVVFLDSDSKWIASYKRMLAPLRERLEIKFFQRPEDLIQYLKDAPVAVVACELDIPFMSGKEMFGMVEIMCPSAVQLAITEMKDMEGLLDTINGSRIFRLLVKPFFLVEDLEKPITEAVAEYQKGKQEGAQYQKKQQRLDQLELECQKLSGKLEEKRSKYAGISDAAVERVQKELETCQAWLSGPERGLVSDACGRMLQEFMECYLFGCRDMAFYMRRYQQMFHRPEEGFVYQAKSKVADRAVRGAARKVAYGMFLGGFLPQQLFTSCQTRALLAQERGAFSLQILCQYPEGQGGYQIGDKKIRQLLGRIVEHVAKALSSQIEVSAKEQVFAIKLIYPEGSGQ